MKTKFLLAFVVLLLILSYFIFNPIVIDSTTQTRLDIEIQVGDTVRPISNFDFSEGDWKAFIVVDSEDDMVLSKKGSVLVAEDRDLLNELKKDWVFVYTGADVATIQSIFLLYRNDTLVFTSNIVADENNNGLQSMNYGWLRSENDQYFLSQCKKFKKGYSPIYWFKN